MVVQGTSGILDRSEHDIYRVTYIGCRGFPVIVKLEAFTFEIR